MDKIGQWRSFEPAEAGASAEPATEKPAEGTVTRGSWRMALAAFLGIAVLGAAGLALWATTPQPQLLFGAADAASPFYADGTGPIVGGTAAPEELIVDVQGAVVDRGLHRLPAGSRVGDAIAAAGGYSGQVDIRAAAERLNLAERLTDGAKIHVPARGDGAAAAAPTGDAPDAGGPAASVPPVEGGLIEINTATEAQLDTLPGIGPVTAGKIMAAREEAPFTSVDELLGRGVVGPATFEKIRQLVTVGALSAEALEDAARRLAGSGGDLRRAAREPARDAGAHRRGGRRGRRGRRRCACDSAAAARRDGNRRGPDPGPLRTGRLSRAARIGSAAIWIRDRDAAGDVRAQCARPVGWHARRRTPAGRPGARPARRA